MSGAETTKDWIQLAPGVRRKIAAVGEKMMQVIVWFEKGAKVPEHAHVHEQIRFGAGRQNAFRRRRQIAGCQRRFGDAEEQRAAFRRGGWKNRGFWIRSAPRGKTC